MFDRPFDAPLPRRADLAKLARNQAHFRVHLDVAGFPRFAAAVHEGKGCVDVELLVGFNEEFLRCITGTVSATVQVICQRCMEPMEIHFGSQVNIGVVTDEERAARLPAEMDSLVVEEDDLVDLNEVVEDELLLGLPFVSYHPVGTCSVEGLERVSSGSEDIAPVVERENPFKVLERLKSGKE